MAILTLPHPNIDFVPLDILTAAEQNQLVANINALATFANGLADGTNLSDDIVLPRHIKNATYSTSEELVGTWIDDKPIYQKSLTFNTTGSGTEETGANNETFDYIDTLISMNAILNVSNGERYSNGYTNPSAPSAQYFQLKFANWGNTKKIRYHTRTAGVVTMTIRYTKSI